MNVSRRAWTSGTVEDRGGTTNTDNQLTLTATPVIVTFFVVTTGARQNGTTRARMLDRVDTTGATSATVPARGSLVTTPNCEYKGF
jgi:hypothetical protein